jgi:hypothetical protein
VAPVAAHVWTAEHVEPGAGESEVARVAAIQKGFVTRAQLAAAGLGRGAIGWRVRSRRLIPYHKGVYLYGRPSLEPLGREWAAILAGGGHAVLSHWSLADLWGLADGSPDEVWLTVVDRQRHSRPGLRVHRTTRLEPDEVRLHRGLPVTTPARLVIDLAPHCSQGRLERLLAQARIQQLVTDAELDRALQRGAHRPGAALVRGLLAAERGPAFTRAELERRLLALIREAGLPAPVLNGTLLGFEVDFHWPEHRLVVETDGFRFHAHARSFERDRRRDQVLVAAGWRVIRITWRQLTDEPLAVLARLAMALAHYCCDP